MDGIQTVLVVVIVTLTLLLLLVGIQVFLITLGIRRILQKIEEKVDQSDLFTQDGVRESVGNIRDFVRKKFLRK
jgi:small-conductance mechanosensitive channel